MRTTLDLSDDLIRELMDITDARTKTSAIEEAIREFIRRKNIEKLRNLSGNIQLADNWRELREIEINKRYGHC